MSQLVIPNTIDAGTEIVASEHQANYTAIRDLINGNIEGGPSPAGNIKANSLTAAELADSIMLQGLPGPDMQEGIVSSGHMAVTPGAGLVLNYAAGIAYIVDDSSLVATGALIPVTMATGGTVTIAANASGNPRIDQVVLTLTGHNAGAVSVVQGTATVGATLANRTGAAALPAGAIRLADVLVPNAFAGPFTTHDAVAVTGQLVDRRPWSRGASSMRSYTVANASITNAGTYVTFVSGALRQRVEIGSGRARVKFHAPLVERTAGAGSLQLVVAINQATVQEAYFGGNTVQQYGPLTVEFETVLTPGSYLFDLGIQVTSGTYTIYAAAGSRVPFMTVDELISPSGSNGTT